MPVALGTKHGIGIGRAAPAAVVAAQRQNQVSPFAVQVVAQDHAAKTQVGLHVKQLARIAVSNEDAERMTGELNAILGFVEQLDEVDVSGVEPMTSVTAMEMKKRQDVVSDGGKASDIVANAPATDENFFLVPKVVE